MSEESARDVYQALLGSSMVFLINLIREDTANNVIAQLMWLDKYRPKELITLYINSTGGSISQGLAIYDVMQTLKNPISTVCIGQALSMAAVLLAAGTPGERYSLPNSRIMLHQPRCTPNGTETNMQTTMEQLTKSRNKLEKLISKHTGRQLEKVHQDFEKDFYMDAQEALEYGLIDGIITKYLLAEKDTQNI